MRGEEQTWAGCAYPEPGDVVRAGARIAGKVTKTPVLHSRVLDEIAGTRVLIKAENLQRSGSFKIRGALNRLIAMTAAERARGVVAWSAGNHGKALAEVGAELSIAVTLVMPHDVPRSKLEAARRLGATIRLYDRLAEDREAIGRQIAAETGAVIVPPYEDRFVIAGGGTAGLELIEAADALGTPLDDMLVCTGGGGLVAGCALAAAHLGKDLRVFSVEPEFFDDTRRSLAEGVRVRNTLDHASCADALLTVTPGEMTFAMNRGLLAGGIAVSEAAIAKAVAFAFHELKLVVEPGGAAALAAVLERPKGCCLHRTLGIVLTGGNVDPDRHAELVARGLAL